MRELNTWRQQVIVRALRDDAFRQEVLADPKVVLERELGITFHQGVSIQVHEDTPTLLHLVLLMKPAVADLRQLSDAQLLAAAEEDGISRPPGW